MNDKKTKQEKFTFFNEEWNQPFFEDGADVIDQRSKKNSGAVED
jgi:hypothetical protein